MKILNSDIVSLINNHKIICYGAGRALQNFLSLFPELHIEKYIEYIVDSDINKQNTTKQIGDKQIPIISLDDAIKSNRQEYRWLITVEDWMEIYRYLDRITLLKETEVYIYSFVISESYQYQWSRISNFSIEKFDTTPQIPKKIHYCWFGGKEIPECNRRMIDSWNRLCPDYEIVEWNEKNYDIGKLKYTKEAYEAKKWAFVSDVARIDILYHEGGIYLDTDVEIIKNLDPLLYQKGFFGVNFRGEVNTGLGFGAVKELRLLQEFYEVYRNASFNADYSKNSIKTCLKYQTEVLVAKYGFRTNGEYQRIQDISIYPEEVCSNVCVFTKREKKSNNTYLLHHAHLSWRDDMQKIEQRQQFWQQHFA